jgi:6-pyruvoyltetrahydropterin/6-carboxytetrahydropterin synthase
MHKAGRQVRFSINPFLSKDSEGFNSFASKPAGEGLSMFFEISVEVTGEVEPATGFVVNVTDIDKNVREFVVPIFAARIRDNYREGRHVGLFEIADLLRSGREQLADKFGAARISQMSLKLNPFRKVTIKPEDNKMIYFSEKFEFAATHKLWNDEFTEERNFEVFGKCANPTGHGHNYVVEVTVKAREGEDSFRIGDFERIVDDELVQMVDHKNLNSDVAEFGKINPTVENIAFFAWGKLAGKFEEARLHCVTVMETDKTYCSYYGQ